MEFCKEEIIVLRCSLFLWQIKLKESHLPSVSLALLRRICNCVANHRWLLLFVFAHLSHDTRRPSYPCPWNNIAHSIVIANVNKLFMRHINCLCVCVCMWFLWTNPCPFFAIWHEIEFYCFKLRLYYMYVCRNHFAFA